MGSSARTADTCRYSWAVGIPCRDTRTTKTERRGLVPVCVSVPSGGILCYTRTTLGTHTAPVCSHHTRAASRARATTRPVAACVVRALVVSCEAFSEDSKLHEVAHCTVYRRSVVRHTHIVVTHAILTDNRWPGASCRRSQDRVLLFPGGANPLAWPPASAASARRAPH